MALFDVIRASVNRSVDLYRELVAAIPEPALQSKLPGLRSNSVGQQLWCVIGARESYGRAIQAGEWKGFSCSLAGDLCHVKSELAQALDRSGADLLAVLESGEVLTDNQSQLLLDLLEHETAHQGQLIRYLYGLNLTIPEGWRSRYALQ